MGALGSSSQFKQRECVRDQLMLPLPKNGIENKIMGGQTEEDLAKTKVLDEERGGFGTKEVETSSLEVAAAGFL